MENYDIENNLKIQIDINVENSISFKLNNI
jgi:hypothetical protein